MKKLANSKPALLTAAFCLSALVIQAQAATVENYWDFEGTSPFADQAGSADGSVTGSTTVTTVTTVAGHGGGTAMHTQSSVSGANDYVSIDGSTLFDPGTGSFSMSLWFRMPDDGSTTINRGLFDFSGFGGDGVQSLYSGSGSLIFRVDGVGTTSASIANLASSGVEDGNWHFAAITYEPGGNLNMYLDGSTPVVTVAALDSSTATTPDNSAWLGTFNYNGTTTEAKGLNGDLDDVAVYGGLLSTAQIGDLYSGSLSPLGIAAVPEPSAAAILSGFGILLLIFNRTRRDNQSCPKA